MKTMRKMATEDRAQRARVVYAAPVLREFGPVGALTQSGTGVSVESSSGGGTMCSNDTMRAMC